MDATTAVGLIVLALAVGVYGTIIGAGGGFLVVAGLILLFDLSGVTAVATSTVATLFIQLTGAYTYNQQGLVDRRSSAWFAIGSVPVAFAAATWLASRIPQRLFELGVGLLLVGLAVFVVLVKPEPAADDAPAEPRRGPLVASGAAVGVLSGAVGAGAGLVTVPILRSIQRMSPHRAAATTTMVGAIGLFAATVGHTIVGNPNWSYTPFLILGAVVGARVGALSAGRLSGQTVLGLLAGGLLLAGVPLIVRSVA